MIDISEIYKPKNKSQFSTPVQSKHRSFDKGTFSKDQRFSATASKTIPSKNPAISRQEQIRKNNEQINKIIRQKKFYLKHKPIFDTVQEEAREMENTHSQFPSSSNKTPVKQVDFKSEYSLDDEGSARREHRETPVLPMLNLRQRSIERVEGDPNTDSQTR